MAELIAALTSAGVPTFFLVPVALLIYLIVQRGNKRDDPYVAAIDEMNKHLMDVKNMVAHLSTENAVVKEKVDGLRSRLELVEVRVRSNGRG